MGHIIEYTKNRLAQIKANYTTELEKAERIPHGLSQVSGNELLEQAHLRPQKDSEHSKEYDICCHRRYLPSASQSSQNEVVHS